MPVSSHFHKSPTCCPVDVNQIVVDRSKEPRRKRRGYPKPKTRAVADPGPRVMTPNVLPDNLCRNLVT
jgi:hypothetical protein